MHIDLNDYSLFSNVLAALRMATINIVMKLAEIGLDPTTLMLWGPSLVLSSFACSQIMNLIGRVAQSVSDHLAIARAHITA